MRRALLTITNDSYLEFTKKLIKSLLNTNPNFSDEIIIMYSDEYTKLSKKSKSEILKLYPNTKFRNYELTEDYRAIQTRLSESLEGANRTRLFHTVWKFELFRDFKEYDEVIFLDSDMLVYSPLDKLYWILSVYKSSPILMCTDEWIKGVEDFKVSTYNGSQYLNTGFWAVRPNLLNPNSYDDLINIALFTEINELPNNGIYADQDIINKYFQSLDNKIIILPKSYNLWSADANNIIYNDNPELRKLSDKISIIHFIAKPHTNYRFAKIDDYWDSI